MPAAPGDRASETPARRALGPPRRASLRPAAGSRRDAATAAANATSPGSSRSTTGAEPPSSSCCPSTVPLAQTARTATSATAAASSSGPRARPPERCGSETVTAITSADSAATPSASASPVGERALREHVADGSAGHAGRHGARHASHHPADRRAAEADGGALGGGQQAALPAPGAVPGQPPSCRAEVATERTRREDGERDEQRRRLAADEQAGVRRWSSRAAQPRAPAGREATRRSGSPAARPAHGRHRRRGRRSSTGAAPRHRAARPSCSSGTSGRGRASDEAGDALGHDERARCRPVVAVGPGERRRELGVREALSVGVRKSPNSWRERSVPVPTWTTRRPGTSGRRPTPRSRSTSQRSGRHERGRRPDRSRTCGASPSTAAMPTKTPPIVLSRTRGDRGRVAHPGVPSARRASASSRDQDSAAPAGTPNHDARTERAAAGRRSTSWATLLSFATVAPTRIPARTPPPRRRSGRGERAAVAPAQPPQAERDDVRCAPHQSAVSDRRRR